MRLVTSSPTKDLAKIRAVATRKGVSPDGLQELPAWFPEIYPPDPFTNANECEAFNMSVGQIDIGAGKGRWRMN